MSALLCRLLAVFFVVMPVFASADVIQPWNRAALAPLLNDEAYILIKLTVKGQRQGALSSISLVNEESGEFVRIAPNGSEPQLLKVKAGKYRLARNAFGSSPPIKGVLIEPRTVTYIGDWAVARGQALKVDGEYIALDSTSYGIAYKPGALSWVAKNYDLPAGYRPVISATSGRQLKARWVYAQDGAIAGIRY